MHALFVYWTCRPVANAHNSTVNQFRHLSTRQSIHPDSIICPLVIGIIMVLFMLQQLQITQLSCKFDLMKFLIWTDLSITTTLFKHGQQHTLKASSGDFKVSSILEDILLFVYRFKLDLIRDMDAKNFVQYTRLWGLLSWYFAELWNGA